MKTYKINVMTTCGRANVTCRSAARTQTGICMALGRAIAKQLGTDVFEVLGYLVREGVARDYSISAWSKRGVTRAEEHMIWSAAHDALMG